MSERAPSAERSLRALATRVDDFERAAVARGADLRCGLGCEACCHVSLSLAPLEAHVVSEALATSDAATLARLDARRSDARVVSGARCVMLEDDGRCAIYDARPLVCRSQGLALAYPPGVVPLESVMATLDDDDDDAHEHERDEREERDERDERDPETSTSATSTSETSTSETSTSATSTSETSSSETSTSATSTSATSTSATSTSDASTRRADLVWCPLNFTSAPPTPEDVLDAGRLDEALALLNRAFAGADALERTPLTELVARAARTSKEP